VTRRKSGDAQPSLPGIVEAIPTHRLFLGLFPDKAALTAVEEVGRLVRRGLELKGPPQKAANFHVTVHHLGDYVDLSPRLVGSALEALEAIDTPAFDILMDHVAGFRGRPQHPIVLRCPEASAGVHVLWSTARAVLAAHGFSAWLEKKFTPHLTLMYADRMPSTPFPIQSIGWNVQEIVLVHSLLGRSEYQFLGSKRLRSS
jgi:RNA 2',3'-cyclic 3'-phosphodiesterase